MQPCRWLPTSRRDPSPPASTLKTVVKLFSETVTTTYKPVRCHNGEDHGCTKLPNLLRTEFENVPVIYLHTLSELKHFKFQIRSKLYIDRPALDLVHKSMSSSSTKTSRHRGYQVEFGKRMFGLSPKRTDTTVIFRDFHQYFHINTQILFNRPRPLPPTTLPTQQLWSFCNV
jgi:hypothetical protein